MFPYILKICLILFLTVIQFQFGRAECDISRLNLSNLTKSGEVLIDCKEPGNTDGDGKSFIKCEGIQAEGTTVNLICPPFYPGEASPTLEKRCLENGTWSNESEQLFCLPDCGLIRRPESQHRPWQVRLSTIINEEQVYLGLGILISKYAVLASENCLIKNNSGVLERLKPSQIVLALAERSDSRHIDVKNIFWSDPGVGSDPSVLVLLELTTEATVEDFVRPVCLPFGEGVFQTINFLQSGDTAQTIGYNNWAGDVLTIANSAECGQDVNAHHICAKSNSEEAFLYFRGKVNMGMGLTIGSERQMLFGLLSDQDTKIGNHFSFTGIQQFIPWIQATLEKMSPTKDIPSNEDKILRSRYKNAKMWAFLQNQLKHKDRHSVQIIHHLSYLSHENIPVDIFNDAFQYETTPASENLSRSISLLMNYSLVTDETTNPGGSISILPELQEIVRFYLSENRMDESVIKSAIILLERKLNGANVSDLVITNAKVVWEHAKKIESLVKEYTTFHLNLLEQLNLNGRYNETIELAAQNLELFVKIYGENHNSTIFIRSRVIHARYKLNEFQKAVDETKVIYPTSKDVLGEDNDIVKYIEENIECMEDEMDGCFTSFCEMEIPDLCLD